MAKKTLFCGPHAWFDDTMNSKGWIDSPGWRVATISAVSPNESYNTHWFSKECKQNLNLDIDDINPFLGRDNYFKLGYNYYRRGYPTYANAFCSYVSGTADMTIHGLDFSEALTLVKFIDDKIKSGYDTFYVHCQAGISRSVGISYYIIDKYNMFDWDTHFISSSLNPNWYIYNMLMYVYSHIYML